MSGRRLFLLAVVVSACVGCDISYTLDSEVFRSPQWAHAWIEAGNITLLDARGWHGGHISGAAHAPWSSFVVSGFKTPTGGLLRSPAELRAAVQALGVSPTKTVLVYGEWEREWGEEGRLHWMLKYLGHPEVYVLAGGLEAYAAAFPFGTAGGGAPVEAPAWDAVAYPVDETLRATQDQLRSDNGSLFVVDARESEEYLGTHTPHGEYRPGHLAGAVSYPMIELWSGKCLQSCSSVRALLEAKGWTQDRRVVAYCTAGIRSGFFWSMMLHCGVEGPSSANYDGSMWEWTHDASNPMCTSSGDARSCVYNPSAASAQHSVVSALRLLSLAAALCFARGLLPQ